MARVYLVAGLGFGDEGKGSTVDFLVRSTGAKLVVRYNGGAQAGHNVVLPDGRHHCFSQFGSGSFVPGVGTHLSEHMIVNPLFMFTEANHLLELGVEDIWSRVTVERLARITNPFQVAANRLRELYRGKDRHGSCGLGIGETVQDALTYGDELIVANLESPEVTERKLRRSQEIKLAELSDLRRSDVYHPRMDVEWAILQDKNWPHELAYGLYRDWYNKVRAVDHTWLETQVNGEGVVIFEGAQGVLLDENYGFHPHTTWSTTTFEKAYDLLRKHAEGVTRVGVTRVHMTRHGNGPFVTEDATLKLDGEHNSQNEWQQNFRVGYFDTVMFKYALTLLGGLDLLVLTHMDKLLAENQVCLGYDNHDLMWGLMKTATDRSVDLNRQERIGQLLTRVKPTYARLSPGEVTELIRENCRTSSTLYSYGPTFESKTFNAR